MELIYWIGPRCPGHRTSKQETSLAGSKLKLITTFAKSLVLQKSFSLSFSLSFFLSLSLSLSLSLYLYLSLVFLYLSTIQSFFFLFSLSFQDFSSLFNFFLWLYFCFLVWFVAVSFLCCLSPSSLFSFSFFVFSSPFFVSSRSESGMLLLLFL